MFGIDFSEVLVIFGIALVVLGPEKLPKLAATIGRWIGRARAMARQFKEQLEQEASTLQRGVDLGPEFHGQAAKPATPSIRPVAPAAAPAGARPTAGTEAAAVPQAAAATDLTAHTGSAPASVAVAEDFGLADTYPAALNRPEPAGPLASTAAQSAAPQPAAAHVNGNGTAPDSPAAVQAPAAPGATTPEPPRQQAFWPPDGLL